MIKKDVNKKELLLVEMESFKSLYDIEKLELDDYSDDEFDDFSKDAAAYNIYRSWKKVDKELFDRLAKVYYIMKYPGTENAFDIDKFYKDFNNGLDLIVKVYEFADAENLRTKYDIRIVLNLDSIYKPRIECYLDNYMYNFQNYRDLEGLIESLEKEHESQASYCYKELIFDDDMITDNTFYELSRDKHSGEYVFKLQRNN